MAVYAATINLKFSIDRLRNHFDVCLDPPSLEIAESVLKELKSFQKFLKRLDGSCRKRMDAPLQQIAAELRGFEAAVTSLFEEQALAQSEESPNLDEIKPYLFSIDLQHLKGESRSLIGALKEITSSRSGYGGSKPKMVGFSDEYEQLKEDVIGEWNRFRKSFSIFGMSGIGKTTLAREIFEDTDAAEHFDFRAWVRVGRECKPCQIPRAILAGVEFGTEIVRREEEEDDEDEAICEHLKEKLDGKRYLIVLDDVMDAQIYDYLNKLLPSNEGDGSKILFTTTIKKVAQHVAENVGPVSSYSLDMRLLDREESWDLLREKLFGEGRCPSQLMRAGKRIADNCDGLPLMIVTIANLLSGVEQTPERWDEIGAQRNHTLFKDAYEEISKVLYPSYEYLPQHLKACFLYMGVFPRNYEIPKSKLINMWIVEEIIEQNMNGCLRDYALECLEELASNSLVMVYKESKSNRSLKRSSLKTCGLHSSWLHLCYKEAKKNNFFHVLNSCEDGLGEGIKGQKRLSVQNKVLFGIKDVHDSIGENCLSTAKSLLFLHPYHQYQVPLCFRLRLLQHLDALNIRFYDFPLEVLKLVRLRYLALTCNDELPTSISELSSLHFLIVNRHFNFQSCGTPSYLPTSIWDMKELKHLEIVGCDLQELYGAMLPNLSTLLGVSALSCTRIVFESLPNLKKLGIRIELAPDVVGPLTCFGDIYLLSNLESLKCEVVNQDYSYKFAALPTLPSSLKRLSLSGLGYSWEETSKIASLPNLEVLKLRCNAFRGAKWEVEGQKFMKVKYLLIEDCDVEQLMVGKRKSFRRLQCLSIQHCYKLEELYWKFYEDLSKIEVVDCDTCFEKQMKEALLWKINMPRDYSWKTSFN